jgi:hypothetical protein
MTNQENKSELSAVLKQASCSVDGKSNNSVGQGTKCHVTYEDF